MGLHTVEKLASLLDVFIDEFVLCPRCQIPETDVTVLKNAAVELFCQACGDITPVNMRHRIISYIQKNPPAPKRLFNYAAPSPLIDHEPQSEDAESASSTESSLAKSQHMSVKLNQFPADVLDHILTIGGVSQGLIELWKSGDSALIAKLASSVSTLALHKPFSIERPLPAVVFQLRGLRSLSIRTNSPISKDHADLVTLLQKLPREIHTLKLTCPKIQAHFDSGVKTSYARGPSTFLDLGSIFPQLHTLGLGSSNLYGELIFAPDLAALPSTLTRLQSPGIYIDYAKGHSSALLPPHLRDLDAVVRINFNDGQLPEYWHLPELEHIFSISIDDAGSTDDVSWLPRSLKNSFFMPGMRLSPRLLRSLPPKFDSITFKDVDTASFAAEGTTWQALMPSHITELLIGPSMVLGREDSRLPRSITTLVKSQAFDPSYLRSLASQAEIDAYWPSNIETFHEITLTAYDDIHLLPKTLRSLLVKFKPVDDEERYGVTEELNLNSLPNLTDLKIDGLPSSQKLRGFPKSLKSLDLLSSDGLDKKTLDELPSSITVLATKFEGFGDDINRPWELPNNLVDLHLHHWNREWMSLIPQTVTKLNIGHLHGVRACDSLQRTLIIEDLPSKMVHLTLCGDDGASPVGLDAHISSRCFTSLKCLKVIRVSQFGCFSSKVLRHLPPSLVSFSVNLEAMDRDDVPFIPPLLISLNLGSHYDKSEPKLGNYWPLRASTYGCLKGAAEERFQQRIKTAALWTNTPKP